MVTMNQNIIKVVRKKLNLPQWKFAARLKVTQSALSHYEGGREPPVPVAYEIISAAHEIGMKLKLEDIYPPAHRISTKH